MGLKTSEYQALYTDFLSEGLTFASQQANVGHDIYNGRPSLAFHYYILNLSDL